MLYEACEEFKEKNENINYFHNYIKRRKRNLKKEDITRDIYREFLYVYIAKNIKKLGEEKLDLLIDALFEFNEYINCDIAFNKDIAFENMHRLYAVNFNFNDYLNIPVISNNPLIIDITKFKRQRDRLTFGFLPFSKDKGFYKIMEIGSNDSLILKKFYTNKFVKIIFNKKLISNTKKEDILHLSLSQNPFLMWEVEDILAYYPKEAEEFLIKEI